MVEIILAVVIVAAVAAAVTYIVKKKKKGECSCGSTCSECCMSSHCHKSK